MYAKILVPLEGTSQDDVVLTHVRRLASHIGATLILIMLHRVTKIEDPFMQRIQVEPGSAAYRTKERAEAYLPQLEESLRKEGIEALTEFRVVSEPEAQAIGTYAQEHGCDLIALTAHGISGLGHCFFSDLEDQLERVSTVPLLLVPGPRS
jgi:nucleotide-binding universal stress UspA family protein